ncbi:hypothetical protein ADUPG1_004654, partial [Aduncisulcus paluster]
VLGHKSVVDTIRARNLSICVTLRDMIRASKAVSESVSVHLSFHLFYLQALAPEDRMYVKEYIKKKSSSVCKTLFPSYSPDEKASEETTAETRAETRAETTTSTKTTTSVLKDGKDAAVSSSYRLNSLPFDPSLVPFQPIELLSH